LGDFRALVGEFDPAGKFRNDLVDRLVMDRSRSEQSITMAAVANGTWEGATATSSCSSSCPSSCPSSSSST
jgi:hypothetical protein